MPLREYQVCEGRPGCLHCRRPFERLETVNEPPLSACPHCGAPVRRLLSAPAIGPSVSSLDQRARQAGFHKLKRLGRGEYEKQY